LPSRSWKIAPLAAVLGAIACATQNVPARGVIDGKLAPCPSAPHCVTSQVESGVHSVAPIHYATSRAEARDRLVEIIRSMPGGEVVTVSSDYLLARFTAESSKSVDDLEVYLDDRQKLIHFRSASRSGFWDFGANRRRVEEIRERFSAQKTTEPVAERAAHDSTG
jgi:uncharacterized protein (DUF1499 family)